MPLTLRRRPRLPTVDSVSPAVGFSFVPEVASRPDAAPAEPARTSATTTSSRLRRRWCMTSILFG